ncbi:MAG TPA: hypothetical protein VHT73_15340 [Thermodesulfobacteriota bacterium]|nr:hypothetical protein [Thermodesulfobacteriota bacterium]
MKITRIYSDSDGESHFEDVKVELQDAGQIGRLSKRFTVKEIIFRENDPDHYYDWHTAPQKQYVILLDGEIEIEVSNGEKRKFRGGDILLVEDVAGRGHRTRTTSRQTRRSIFITLE